MFFVMLNHPSPHVPALPMVGDSSDDVAFFDSYDHACEAAESSSLGDAYGFDVFELGSGC